MIYRFLKYQVLSFFILFIVLSNSYSEIVKSIDISGNNRVNSQTIKIFGGVSVGDDLNKNDLNDILKKLYETNFFKNVDVSLNQSVLSISVEENPIVQNLIVQGIKNKDLDKSVKEIISIKEKNPYIENQVEKEITKIKNFLYTSRFHN